MRSIKTKRRRKKIRTRSRGERSDRSIGDGMDRVRIKEDVEEQGEMEEE